MEVAANTHSIRPSQQHRFRPAVVSGCIRELDGVSVFLGRGHRQLRQRRLHERQPVLCGCCVWGLLLLRNRFLRGTSVDQCGRWTLFIVYEVLSGVSVVVV
ncbi:hypothetical protein SRHO_G00175540 [Serrasalmus rhombeus]